MMMGTKSLLYGTHCLLIHPWFVAAAWWKLFGLPWDPRLWFAFVLHDIGYWGLPNMDGPEGEKHPEVGARWMGVLFDRRSSRGVTPDHPGTWARFCLYHSRYYAARDGARPSRLCMADKLATAMEPAWLYLARARATGEIYEYMKDSRRMVDSEPWAADYARSVSSSDCRVWFEGIRAMLRAWVKEHAEGKPDGWTRARDGA